MVIVNGKETQADGKTVAEIVAAEGFAQKPVAVELNEDILPKREHESTVLRDGDVLEIVNFVGGG